MESRRHNNNKFGRLSYSNLFNLESLMNFQLPRADDDVDNYGRSSEEESRSSQGLATMMDRSNGSGSDFLRHRKRPASDRAASLNSSEDDDYYESRITEDYYRTMLGEHVQKYRKGTRRKEVLPGPPSVRTGGPVSKSNHGSKGGRFGIESPVPLKEETGLREMDASSGFYEEDYGVEYGSGGNFPPSLEEAYLDIGEGIKYQIPPTYDKLASMLKLPTYSEIRIDEYILKGNLDVRSLAAFVASDRRFETRNRGGLGEPRPQFQSLQARLKSAPAGNSNQKFTLQVSDMVLKSFSIPEGAAGRIRRSIMSESGNLHVYYVKVLEKGDTYEIIERSLPKKQILKKDPSVIEKEETEKVGKVWVNIVRRDIPRHHRIFTNLHKKLIADAKRCSETCQREVKMKVGRSIKLMRTAANRTRRLSKDMLLFWKRVEKEQAEVRKKEEREAAEALKREQELREARRQQQRLNFLLSQTELYSHFMQNKSAVETSETLPLGDGQSQFHEASSLVDGSEGEAEDPEEAELKREAMRAAQLAVTQQKKITDAFDHECLKFREGAEATDQPNDMLFEGSTNINLLHPSTMPVMSSVHTPEMFKGSLKEYQLKGLQWLVNCYEQGLNGILADEMGLGKTIQAMVFLAHLAEEKNIWGPFLVVAPASVLNNWADEVNRFCPDLKTLPYWGGPAERNVLRKYIVPKRLYRKESEFHILITSYQLLVADEKILKRVKWQYMVLDEAQAIKSSSSIRWKTLLSFNCRNRLLLTGTPIQNNMAELWALLHFIMPTLFDSHEQFNEWFSKGIENHAEHGGTLNEHQLNRLHAILKPFMLRRVKKDVISEMTAKNEVTVHCKLSSRQQAFYQAIKNKISLAELFDSRRGSLTDNKIRNLMNIVIQLRKVCNHPELFERNEGRSYFFFGDIPNPVIQPPLGPLEVHYAGRWNPITYEVPKLIHLEITRSFEMPCTVAGTGLQHETLYKLFNIFTPENIYRSSLPSTDSIVSGEAFGFTRLIDLSPVEVSFLGTASLLERLLYSVSRWEKQFIDDMVELFMESEVNDTEHFHLEKGKIRAVKRLLLLPSKSVAPFLRKKLATGPDDAPFEALVMTHEDRFMSNIKLLRSTYACIPTARAPPINAHCSDRSFAYQMVEELHHPWAKRLFLGFARTSEHNGPRKPKRPHYLIQEIDSELPVVQPALKLAYNIFGSSPPIQSFDPAKMLTDSGKLQTLDILLKRLRAENHRILLFAQMTKMLNILEDYMNYRKYKYFRLDGSSTIMDRRDMVRDFQRRNDVFVFLLSTRAGGLGINLTAADTVIFYESDWNPTLDLQAMDRAHRLGQTKEVTVYRLICKETVEEKILHRASQKNAVQQLVMTGGHVQGDLLKPEDVVSLLIDDAQLEQKLRSIPLQAKDRQNKKRVTKAIRVDADGDVTLEEVGPEGAEYEPSQSDGGKSSNKKRKSNSDKSSSSKARNPSKAGANEDIFMETDEHALYDEQDSIQLPTYKPKGPRRNANENYESPSGSALSSEYQDNANADIPGFSGEGTQVANA